MSKVAFDLELDCQGLLCPLSVVKTRQVMAISPDRAYPAGRAHLLPV